MANRDGQHNPGDDARRMLEARAQVADAHARLQLLALIARLREPQPLYSPPLDQSVGHLEAGLESLDAAIEGARASIGTS